MELIASQHRESIAPVYGASRLRFTKKAYDPSGDRRVPGEGSPRSGEGPAAPVGRLPSLSCHNSIGADCGPINWFDRCRPAESIPGPGGQVWHLVQEPVEADKPVKYTSRDKMRFYALQQNVEHFVNFFGREFVGMLTLTFDRDGKTWDYKEASRRFNSAWTNLGRGLFRAYIAVKEPHRDGSVHFHLIVATHEPIRCDNDAVEGGDYSSANEPLRRLWKTLRKGMKKYGFGKQRGTHLLPVRRNAEAVSRYVAKYLSKSQGVRHDPVRKIDFRGARLVVYSKYCPRVVKGEFSWHSPGATNWRFFVRKHAQVHGIQCISEMSKREGRYWGWRLMGVFTEFLDLATRQLDPARFIAHELNLPPHLWPPVPSDTEPPLLSLLES